MARIGAALGASDDAELAEIGRFLLAARGVVACLPRALAEPADAPAAPPPPAPAPPSALPATPGATLAPPADVAPPRLTSTARRLLGPVGARCSCSRSSAPS